MEREPRFFNQAYAADCCRGDPAFCTCACPFQLDVRDFITKILRGGFDAAYRKFRDAVIFPQIVTALCPSPCREVCPRGAVDAAISLRELEQAAIRYAHSLDPTNFNLSAKNDRIAVVGAGPSGLACALRLAAKKYQVTVFEKSSRLGGSLWQLLDPEVFLPDIERQGKYAAYELLLQREIIGPEQLEGFDGVYVATGKDGHPLGLDAGFDQDLLSTGKPGWFWGGALVGADPMAAIAQGGRAALHLEKYLKIKAMTFAPELKPQTRLQLEVTGLPLRPAVPAGAEGYTKAAAQAEAARCLRCDCSACYDYCDFMQYYRKYPRQLADAVDYGLTDSILETQTNNRMVNSCTGCGVCQAVCPLKVDSGGELQAAREQMLDKGLVPPAYHDFWLRDLEHATAPEIALTLAAPSGKHKLLLFPGC